MPLPLELPVLIAECGHWPYEDTHHVPRCADCIHQDLYKELLPCNDCQGVRNTDRSYFRDKRSSGCLR